MIVVTVLPCVIVYVWVGLLVPFPPVVAESEMVAFPLM